MSNVIPFRRPAAPAPQRPAPILDPLEALAANHMTVSSTVLLEGLDDIEGAVRTAVRTIRAMPHGRARDLAREELRQIRAHLTMARRRDGDVDPAA